MIRKDVRSVKSIRNKLYNARKYIDTFKVNSQICKTKRVNVITKQIHKSSEKIYTINVKSIKLHKKSTNSTKIFELKRLKSEIEICRNKTIKYTARNERCMDDLKKLLNNEPCDNEPIDNEPCDAVNNNREKSTDHKVSDNEPINNEPNNNELIDNQLNNNNELNHNNEPLDNEPNNNEPIDNEPNNNEPCDNKEKSTDHKAYDKINKLTDQVNLIAEVRKGFLNNIKKICILMNELEDEI